MSGYTVLALLLIEALAFGYLIHTQVQRAERAERDRDGLRNHLIDRLRIEHGTPVYSEPTPIHDELRAKYGQQAREQRLFLIEGTADIERMTGGQS